VINGMEYHREGLRHVIERALKRNSFTASESIRVRLFGDEVLLYGSVRHPHLIAEAVATVEAVAPFLRVYSYLRVSGVRTRV
jgi:osmotically-inducible protein OsmY